MSRYATLLVLLAGFLATLLPVAGCDPDQPSEDERFVALVGRYLDGMLERNPVWATNLGDHRFDGRSPDFSAGGIAQDVAFTQAYLDTLRALAPKRLSQVNAIDYEILAEHLEYDLFMATEIREHQWNPLVYNPGDGIYNLIARDYAPLSERLASVRQRLDAIPELLVVARANLENPPRIFTETAITQNRGTINLVMDGLQSYLTRDRALTAELKSELMRARARAIAALEEHGLWLEEDLLPRSNGSFRLGERLYRQKLRFALASDRDSKDILARAERDLADTRHQMRMIATPLFVEFFPSAGDPDALPEQEVIASVLEKLAQDRPNDATIVPQAERDLSRLTEFVREQGLVTVPDDPVRLIVMPEHQRGLYIGYCDSPGPLEERGETFFAIAPTPADWPPERKESFYAEYNDYMLQNLTIHEAMPGHYLQLAHANKFEAPTPLRAIFSSGTFVEGWATYAERLMVEAGWGGPQLHLQQLKMRLRLIINAIIDPKIHAGEMTEEQALAMMMIEGFQEEGEAVGKWRRACLTSTQLSTYYIGNIEINDIRRDYEAEAGNRFDYREFHDELLSFGSPPPKYVRQLLGL